MLHFSDEYWPEGHLEIWKYYTDDRSPEKVLDDHNVIVSGMGVTLAHLMSGSGSPTINDYQLRLFQVGVSGDLTNYEASPSAFVSANELVSSLSEDQYGIGSNLSLLSHTLFRQQGDTVANQIFAQVPYSMISRIDDDSVRFTLLVDENTANDITLNEVGLFSFNPKNQSPEESILCAYRVHSSIPKTDDFSLVYRWTIRF